MVMEYETDPRGAAIEFRKHLGWYAKGLHGGAELRKRLYAVTSFSEVEGIFGDYLADRERYAPATGGGEDDDRPFEATAA
jgi:tRNA-dihydrouridine synthase B